MWVSTSQIKINQELNMNSMSIAAYQSVSFDDYPISELPACAICERSLEASSAGSDQENENNEIVGHAVPEDQEIKKSEKEGRKLEPASIRDWLATKHLVHRTCMEQRFKDNATTCPVCTIPVSPLNKNSWKDDVKTLLTRVVLSAAILEAFMAIGVAAKEVVRYPLERLGLPGDYTDAILTTVAAYSLGKFVVSEQRNARSISTPLIVAGIFAQASGLTSSWKAFALADCVFTTILLSKIHPNASRHSTLLASMAIVATQIIGTMALWQSAHLLNFMDRAGK
jgi:hypothetical protein